MRSGSAYRVAATRKALRQQSRNDVLHHELPRPIRPSIPAPHPGMLPGPEELHARQLSDPRPGRVKADAADQGHQIACAGGYVDVHVSYMGTYLNTPETLQICRVRS